MQKLEVKVKWCGQIYELELDLDEPTEVFKMQLYSMTGVEPERQKIIGKGGRVLHEDTDLKGLGLKKGFTFMMMGSSAEIPRAPENQVLFVEDMTDRQLAETLKLPAGLTNLGNTCYMNATLQCLRSMPELHQSLNRFSSGMNTGYPQKNLTASLRDLFQQLNQTTEGYSPFVFLQMLRAAFPQFAQQNNHGFMQQDAEECWTEIVSSMKMANIPLPNNDSSSSSSSEETFVDRYMTGEFTSTLKCDEAPEEEPVVTKDVFTKLNCFISEKTDYMTRQIDDTLKEEKVNKNSPTLGRSVNYSKYTRISRLPEYLTVQFVRFFWKSHIRKKVKVLRKVKYPLDFDLTELCTDELKEKLLPVRDRLIELEKEKLEAKRKAKITKDSDEKKELEEIGYSSKIEEIKKLVNPELAADVGSNVTGLYELCAVLTHIGRYVDSGHYIGWVRKEDSSEDWIKYDDDKVSIVKKEDIQKLDGGGDWHMAYVLLYRSKKIE
ncbi:hypothetical protein Glove_49g20 [Diversispora epigaea]|uniref:Ubiquitin carboxyl-terminal hydrolase n=1 Tax=Diversispora epigaea TaxID=1348612 RepID=A0A397JN30_9GLOM|nr:hypothetical protein Glove_49g20 [Diversispora epigaea]